MTCRELKQLVTDYFEHVLAPQTRADFEAHLAACSDCKKYFDEMRALIYASHEVGEKLNREWQSQSSQTQEEFLEKLQSKGFEGQPAADRPRRGLVPAAATIVTLVIAAGLWFHWRSAHKPPPTHRADLTLDLTSSLRLRGAEQPSNPPVQLKPALLNLTILLPVGEEPGRYEVAVVQNGRISVQADGEGKLENHVTTLHLVLDCRGLATGGYVLGIRRVEQTWEEYPALVR